MLWILFISGLGLVVSSLGYLYFAWRSVQWPTTQGKVLQSKVLEVRVHSSSVHKPVLVYEYIANGISRKSNKIGFFVGTQGKEWSERLIAGRPEGAEVSVHYHPTFQRIAVLEPGIRQAWAWLTLFGFGALIALSSGIALFADNRYLLLDTLFRLVP